MGVHDVFGASGATLGDDSMIKRHGWTPKRALALRLSDDLVVMVERLTTPAQATPAMLH